MRLFTIHHSRFTIHHSVFGILERTATRLPNCAAITKPRDYFVNFKCPAIYSILIRPWTGTGTGLQAWAKARAGPFCYVRLVVEMFMKQLGSELRTMRPNGCNGNFKVLSCCQTPTAEAWLDEASRGEAKGYCHAGFNFSASSS